MNIQEELKKLEILKDQGLLSEKSFEAQKKVLSTTEVIVPQDFMVWKSYKDYWFQNAVFTGRTNRTEFFWVSLINAFLWFLFGFSILYGFVSQLDINTLKGKIGSFAVFLLLLLTFILPNMAIVVRRLHDVGYSGWLILKIFLVSLPLFFFENPIIFIPAMMSTAVLSLLLLIRIMLPGNRFKNAYGKPIFFMRDTLEEAWIYWSFTFIACVLFGTGYVNFTRINSFGLALMITGIVFFITGTILYISHRKKDSTDT